MFEFRGFDDWVPIFRGGRQTDSQGREHDGDALIDKAVAKFNAAIHEPPAVIGHPQDNAPAYGWVEALKAAPAKGGKLLLAKFKQVQPVFAAAVKEGLYKKRSAAFYPDGTLRHVGFLGAMPPAVKGLPDPAFAEFAQGEAVTFDFADWQSVWAWEAIAGLFGKIRDYLIEKEGVEKADQLIGSYRIQEIAEAAAREKESLRQAQEGPGAMPVNAYSETNKEVNEMMKFAEFMQKLKELVAGVETPGADPGPGRQFSEADVEAIRKGAAELAAAEERKKAAAEFAEKERTSRQEARRREIASWCDTMVAQGKMTPAMVKFGVPQMLSAFAEKEDAVEFGEGDGKVQATLYERFKELFEKEMPKVVVFGEVARGTGTVDLEQQAAVAAMVAGGKERR